MKQVVNSLNYNFTSYRGEINNLPSQTIPDQTMSLREILDRHGRGLPVTGKEPIYYADEQTGEAVEMPDLRRLDLSEIQDLKEFVNNDVELLKNQARVEQTERAKKLAEEKQEKQKSLWNQFTEWQKQRHDDRPSELPK